MKSYQITQWCRHFIEDHVRPGDICIDATMGNGNDTLLLSQLAGSEGKVFAFDIQEEALLHTQERLHNANACQNYSLLLKSHVHMKDYVEEASVSCITFNLGYLPGGDHTKATKAQTSLQAVCQGLSLLKKGGLMSLCIYSGKDTGFEEKNTLLEYLKTLDSRKYLVICTQYYNRPNHPPVPVLIIKL